MKHVLSVGARDIFYNQVKEPDYSSMSTGKLKYLPPRFMTVNTAIEQLLEVETTRNEVTSCSRHHMVDFVIDSLQEVVLESSMAVGMARLGQCSQKVTTRTAVVLASQLHACGESMSQPRNSCLSIDSLIN